MSTPSNETLRVIGQAIGRRQNGLLQCKEPDRAMRDCMFLVMEALLVDLCIERFRSIYTYLTGNGTGFIATIRDFSVLKDGRIQWFVDAKNALNCTTYRQVMCQTPRLVVSAAITSYLSRLHAIFLARLRKEGVSALQDQKSRSAFERTSGVLLSIWRSRDQEFLHIVGHRPLPVSDAALKGCPLLVRSASSKGKLNISSSQSPRENDNVETASLTCYDIPNALAFADDDSLMQTMALAVLTHLALAPADIALEKRCETIDRLVNTMDDMETLVLVQVALHVAVLMRFDGTDNKRDTGPRTIAGEGLARGLVTYVMRETSKILEESRRNQHAYLEALGAAPNAQTAPHLTSTFGKLRFIFDTWSVAVAAQRFVSNLSTQGLLVHANMLTNTGRYVSRLLGHLRGQLFTLRNVLGKSASVEGGMPKSRTQPMPIPMRDPSYRSLPAPFSHSPLDEGKSESATASEDDDETCDEDSQSPSSPFEIGSPLQVRFGGYSPERRSSSPLSGKSPPKKGFLWQKGQFKKARRRLVSLPENTRNRYHVNSKKKK